MPEGIPKLTTSKISIVWIEWLMEERIREGVKEFHITHALKGTEKRIPHISSSGRKSYFHCDGFRETMTTMLTILEQSGTSWDVTIMDMDVTVLKGTENTNHCIIRLAKLQTNFTKLH